ncbi:MAG: CDP-diacylglycerol--glycerol-3-phosphate 3-phosphatidyltransferase, partial [Planctomycetota bacterium]
SFVEHQGGDFSAKWAGKWKMVLQCAAACLSMAQMTYFDSATSTWTTSPPDWLRIGLTISLWSAVALTAYSGLAYVGAVIAMMRKAP